MESTPKKNLLQFQTSFSFETFFEDFDPIFQLQLLKPINQRFRCRLLGTLICCQFPKLGTQIRNWPMKKTAGLFEKEIIGRIIYKSMNMMNIYIYMKIWKSQERTQLQCVIITAFRVIWCHVLCGYLLLQLLASCLCPLHHSPWPSMLNAIAAPWRIQGAVGGRKNVENTPTQKRSDRWSKEYTQSRVYTTSYCIVSQFINSLFKV